MRVLPNLTRATIYLSERNEDSIVYIYKIDSLYNLHIYSRVGRRNLLFSIAIGKLLLARCDVSKVSDILADMIFTVVPPALLPIEKSCCRSWSGYVRRGFGKDTDKSRRRGCAISLYRFLIGLASLLPA